MPTGTLPEEGKRLWESVYDKALKGSCDGDKECAAGSAWKAVKNAGWHKDGDKWVKKANLQEFALRIEKASFDKATGERRWRAVASDTDEDLRKDNMTLQLFSSFVKRIEDGVEAPIPFQSEYWKGGMPYVSVSHYDDLDGEAVPGPVDAVYIDGKFLKSRGRFDDDPLGRACFDAVCKDLYGEAPTNEKIRISIGFLDWLHKHKSNDYMFERKELSDICPECLKELITGESEGLEFLDGQLVHLALTRVPANPRTMMEVEKSMTTQKEDAASIVGDELAEEIEQKSKVTKSDVLVVKMDDEKHMKDKKEEDEDEEEMKDKKMKKSQVEVDPLQELKNEISELKNLVAKKEDAIPNHPLDESIAVLRSAYDQAIAADGVGAEDRLKVLQQPFEHLGNFIAESVKKSVPAEVQEKEDVMVKLSDAITALQNEVGLLRTQMNSPQTPSPTAPAIPQRRSIDPAVLQSQAQIQQPQKFDLHAHVRRSVGLQN